MDYNEFEWVVVEPRPTYRSATIRHLILLIPLGVILSIIAYFLSINSPFPFVYILTFYIFIVIATLLVVNNFWMYLSTKIPPRIMDCKLDESGVRVGKNQTPLSDFNPAVIKSFCKDNTLEYEQWYKINPTNQKLILSVPTKQNTLNLFFSNEYDRQKFIQSFDAHFK